MRVLITGATGFAGRHLSELALSKKGVQVYGLARAGSEGRLVPGVRALRADLLSPASVLAAFKKGRPDRVYHLAGQASVALSWKKPKETFDVNVGGARNLLEAARKTGSRARILVAGSADEYGASAAPGLKLDETRPLRPLNPYGSSKLAQELLALQYYSEHGLHVVRTRAFNHIGPGQQEAFAVPGFARQVALIERGRQAPSIKVGNLEAIRDFTDVRDVARAYWLALEKGRSGDVYVIASGKGRPVRDVLQFYLKVSSVKIEVCLDRKRLRPSDAPFLVGDPRKLERAAGWRPRIRFERTLRDVLNEWRTKTRG